MSLAQVQALSKQLTACQQELTVLDSYYDGTQAISFVHPDVRRLVGNRLTTLVLNWPAHVLDSLENRLDVEGFRLGGADEADKDLWATWQANNMDVESGLGHLESFLYGRSAVSVWPQGNTSDTPVFSVETPREVVIDYAPGTRKVRSALKQWVDGDMVNVSLFLPDTVEVYQGRSRSTVNGQASAPYDVSSVVKLVDVMRNPLGVVPIVPLVNRRRTARLDGQSELAPIIPLADAVNKLATDMMVTSEFHAAPRRVLTGIQLPASGGEGADTRARLRAEVEAYIEALAIGRDAVLGNGADLKQLPAADLSHFVSAIQMLVTFLGSLGVLPPHYMGIATANPPSADAIRSSEAILVKRASRKQQGLGGSWETAQCYGQAIKEGVKVADLDPRYLSMETVWANPETQTVGQLGDFAGKMVESEIMAVPTAQEWIGMTPQQRARDAMFRRSADPMLATEERLALAHQLVRTGLDPETALQQAGLTAAIAAAHGFVATAADPSVATAMSAADQTTS